MFSIKLLEELDRSFVNTDSWRLLTGAAGYRHEQGITSTLLNKEIIPIIEFIEKTINKKIYPNATQLWYDHAGYQNGFHTDLSPNLAVNLQVYLNDSDSDIGTSCFDDAWYSVPFKKNSGYILIGPTKIKHGMKSIVKDKRLSLYQSFRDTKEISDIW